MKGQVMRTKLKNIIVRPNGKNAVMEFVEYDGGRCIIKVSEGATVKYESEFSTFAEGFGVWMKLVSQYKKLGWKIKKDERVRKTI